LHGYAFATVECISALLAKHKRVNHKLSYYFVH
jgi:hypothetical protein